MKEEEYMRVGTTLYKVVNQPCANGGYEKKRVVWNNSTLRQDYGKNYLATVPKYDGFCTVPNHLNYQKEIEGFLNLYEPIEHKPQQGDFSHIQSLMRHIFGEQYELAWIICNCCIYTRHRSCPLSYSFQKNATQAKVRS